MISRVFGPVDRANLEARPNTDLTNGLTSHGDSTTRLPRSRLPCLNLSSIIVSDRLTILWCTTAQSLKPSALRLLMVWEIFGSVSDYEHSGRIPPLGNYLRALILRHVKIPGTTSFKCKNLAKIWIIHINEYISWGYKIIICTLKRRNVVSRWPLATLSDSFWIYGVSRILDRILDTHLLVKCWQANAWIACFKSIYVRAVTHWQPLY